MLSISRKTRHLKERRNEKILSFLQHCRYCQELSDYLASMMHTYSTFFESIEELCIVAMAKGTIYPARNEYILFPTPTKSV